MFSAFLMVFGGLLALILLPMLFSGKGSFRVVFRLDRVIEDIELALFVNTHTHNKQRAIMRERTKETVIEEWEFEAMQNNAKKAQDLQGFGGAVEIGEM